jgi:DNA-binding PadR family transcriptional regulator
MIPMYILGLLQRFGPQHGYQIKKTIAEQLADFTQIKLPTIYYHLKKMEEAGLLSSNTALSGRPEKTIYTVTDKGLEAFRNMLNELIRFEYRPVFPTDGVFYFSDCFQKTEILEHLKIYIDKLKNSLALIDQHKNETMPFVPEEIKPLVRIIFSHHERHFRAELEWAEEALKGDFQ